MSFLDNIADFSCDSSDEEEFIEAPTITKKNSTVTRASGNIHRLSNITETLKNMSYNQDYNQDYNNIVSFNNLLSNNQQNNNLQNNNNTFSAMFESHNDALTKVNSQQLKIKQLNETSERLHKIIKIKTQESREVKEKCKTLLKNNKELNAINHDLKNEYNALNIKIEELNATHDNMTCFIKELKDLIQNNITVFQNNNSESKKDTSNNKHKTNLKKRKRGNESSLNVNEDSNETLSAYHLEEINLEENDIASKDINSSIDMGNIITNKKRKRENPIRFGNQTFKNF